MKSLFVVIAFLPLIFGYGVPSPTPHDDPKYQKEKPKLIFPIEPQHKENKQVCLPSTVIKVSTEVVPTQVTVDKYVTQTLDKYVTETSVQKLTETVKEVVTSVLSSYFTHTDTVFETKLVPTTEVVYSTIYSTVTDVVKEIVTKTIAQELTKEAEKHIKRKEADERLPGKGYGR